MCKDACADSPTAGLQKCAEQQKLLFNVCGANDRMTQDSKTACYLELWEGVDQSTSEETIREKVKEYVPPFPNIQIPRPQPGD